MRGVGAGSKVRGGNGARGERARGAGNMRCWLGEPADRPPYNIGKEFQWACTNIQTARMSF